MIKILIAASLFLLLFFSSCSEQKGEESGPVLGDQNQEIRQLGIDDSDDSLFRQVHLDGDTSSIYENDESVIAYGFVELMNGIESVTGLAQGDTFKLTLDNDLVLQGVIRRKMKEGENITRITTDISEPYKGNITLTIRDGKVTGLADVSSEGRMFYIRYHDELEAHYIAEVDPQKLDIRQESAPIENR